MIRLAVDQAPGQPEASDLVETGTLEAVANHLIAQLRRTADSLVGPAGPGQAPISETRSAVLEAAHSVSRWSGIPGATEPESTQGRTGPFCEETIPLDPATSGRSVPRQRLGDYEVIEEVGRGGMGVVFKVHDVALGRVAALKVIRHLGAADGESMDRFFRAARLWARLDHASIVPIYNVGHVDGTPYVVSQFIDGVDLSALVSTSGGVPANDAARIFAEVADALSFAHARGVIHRDVKPSNIMIKPDGHPVLVDFGLARSIADDGEASLSVDGAILGTPSYMAPEQALGRLRELGPAADVYSLGAALYTVLAGRPPFRGQSVLETLQQIREVEPLPPRRFVPTLPRDLETICLRAMAKHAADRYGSAREMADDLRRFLEGEPIRARAQGAPERLARWVRRRPGQLGTILLAITALSLIGFQQLKLHEAYRRLNEVSHRDTRRIINQIAEGELRGAVELGETRVRDQHQIRGASRSLASTYHRLGDLLVNTDRLSDASAAYEKAIMLLRQHLSDQPGDVASRIELADVLCNLGEAFWALGQATEARMAYRVALTVNQRLVSDFPGLATGLDALGRTRSRFNQVLGVADPGSKPAPDLSPRR
jgi:tetratricopeptide (TPR) repeat protein